MSPNTAKSEIAAQWATVLAVAVAAAAFFDTARTNRQTTYAQTEALAIGLFDDYVKLAIEHPQLADRPDTLKAGGTYEWVATQAYVNAETIYKFRHGVPEWDSTVASMVRYHHALVRDGLFSCADYDQDFVEFVRTQLNTDFRCAAGDRADTTIGKPPTK
jgi:hypothetical protein